MKILCLMLMTLRHVYSRVAKKKKNQKPQIFNIDYFPVHVKLKFIEVNFFLYLQMFDL